MKKDLIGYVRDLVAACLGLYLLFGGELNQEQIAGILLVVTTASALGTHIYDRVRS